MKGSESEFKSCDSQRLVPYSFPTATPIRQPGGKGMIEDEKGALNPAPPEAHDKDQTKQILVKAFHSVQYAASSALGEEILINVLRIPNYSNVTLIGSVFDAVEEIGLPIHQPGQVIRWLNAARLAYGLNSCQAFRLTQKGCNIDDGPHQIVYVDYQSNFLELKVAPITEYGAFPEHHRRVSLWDDGKNAFVEIRHALAKFAQSSVFIPKDPHLSHFEFLRAIVVSSEVSQPSVAQIHTALIEAFPRQESEIRDSINPPYVGAVGAAFVARYFSARPEVLEDKRNSISHAGKSDHSEL
ncbi:MAG: hypothetical protein Q9191_006918 [Dirinaria sp. TL-2023a]